MELSHCYKGSLNHIKQWNSHTATTAHRTTLNNVIHCHCNRGSLSHIHHSRRRFFSSPPLLIMIIVGCMDNSFANPVASSHFPSSTRPMSFLHLLSHPPPVPPPPTTACCFCIRWQTSMTRYLLFFFRPERQVDRIKLCRKLLPKPCLLRVVAR